ncbi:hypothetical protein ACGF3G_00675 [Streptomyces sp. NPDC048179]|uniref:hypothetical protein n=1 Tax=Streptomyces sp. NPDC048179 TaxID=3365506 RepID=UPI00371FCC4E
MKTTTAAPRYWRTGKGQKRHASEFCANGRRSVFTGDVTVIPAGQVKDWAPCKFCCTTEEIAAFGQEAPAAATPAKTYCANTGVENARKVYSRCTDCGKGGSVNRRTGTLRAHEPAKQ